jgi:hypothetical protein
MYKKKKKREKKAKKQKFGRRLYTILGPLDKKSVALPTELSRLGCKFAATKYLYSDRHYESLNLEQLGIVLCLDIIYIHISTYP